MKITYKINGSKVTQEEFQKHNHDEQLMVEMLSSRQAPRCSTDDVFLSGVGNLDQQIPDEQQLDLITKTAMAHGYKPKATDFYNSSLADFPGDPKAFLNHGQLSLQKRLEEKGMTQDRDGDVKVLDEPKEDPYLNPKLKLHPSIARRIKQDRIKDNPDLARKDQRELEEEIVDTHGWNETR